jgi:hypothetical protein
MHTRRSTRARWRPLILLVAVLATALALYALRLASLARALEADVRAAEALSRDLSNREALRALGPHLISARHNAQELRAAGAPLAPLAPLAAHLPHYGPDLAAAPELLTVAADLSAAAADAYTALTPLLAGNGGESPGATLATQLNAARPQLTEARLALDRSEPAMAHLLAAPLGQTTRNRLERVASLLPAGRDALDLALAAPELLGANGERHFLVLAQNPDELRATGGFISGAGVLSLANGEVNGFTIDDSAAVDAGLSAIREPLAPAPMRRYMGETYDAPLLWVFRDANWSPDFPTAARDARDLFARGQGRQVDGVVALDPSALALLLEATGPVTVEGEQVSSETALQYMRDRWSLAKSEGRGIERKAFMAPLGRAVLERLPRVPPETLARALVRALDAGHLLVSLDEPRAAAALARRGWDGAVQPGDADFLMVVDANVGYNKVNPAVARSIAYAVDLSDVAAPRGSVRVQHVHQHAREIRCRQLAKPFAGAVQRYEDLIGDCYWAYLRVLTPGASTLVSAEVQPVPGEWMASGVSDGGAAYDEAGEAETRVFASLVALPPGGWRETVFRYQLPPQVLRQGPDGWTYTLRLQQQPGQRQRVDVALRLPPGAQVVSTSTPPASQAGQLVSFAIDAQTNLTLTVTFQVS